MKLGRQSVIMEIINERDIETQNQLMDALAERGVKSTQATLSRDIRDMRLVKELGPKGNYRYVAAAKQETPDLDDKDTVRSRYYVVRELDSNDNYTISIIYDSRSQLKSMELFGVLDDGSFCLLRTALESIHNSSAIANRFMGYIGIVISLAGALFALFLATKLTHSCPRSWKRRSRSSRQRTTSSGKTSRGKKRRKRCVRNFSPASPMSSRHLSHS